MIEIEVKHEQSTVKQRKNGLANAERLFPGTESRIPFWLRCRRYTRECQVCTIFYARNGWSFLDLERIRSRVLQSTIWPGDWEMGSKGIYRACPWGG
nr:MAG TPA: hypothetical protein [Caudoviricetes sp.]